MSDGLIGHYIGDKYVRLSRLESVKLSRKEGSYYQTWDIGYGVKRFRKGSERFLQKQWIFLLYR